MSGGDDVGQGHPATSAVQKGPKIVSRRTFVQSLGAIGVGSAFFSSGGSRRARAQPASTYFDSLSPGKLTAMYTDMLKVRLWETKIKDLALKGGFRGVAHLYVGEEAVAVGVCSALKPDDYIASTHRGHGHLIAKGGDLNLMPAEITHKAAGYCKGYGGSLHITDISLGILGMNGIVGASHLLGAGAAYGIKVNPADCESSSRGAMVVARVRYSTVNRILGDRLIDAREIASGG